jgi:hypothetical protein
MLFPLIDQQPVPGSRFTREPSATGTGRRYALEGDARPGDVLALAGGALVYDVNANGRVDGLDALVGDADTPPRYGLLVDLRA